MPAFVQQVANNIDTSTTLTLTLPANATAGNKVFVSVGYLNSSSLTTSASGLGATWTRLFQLNAGFNLWYEIWEGSGVTGGTAAVTLTASGSTYWDGNAAEFSGVNYVGTATGSLVTVSTATTAAQSLSSGDIAYALIGWNNSVATATYTDSPGAWVTLTKAVNASQGQSLEPGYRVATGSESATRQATFGTSKNIGIASVLLAASAPVTRRPRPPVAVTRQALVRASVR